VGNSGWILTSTEGGGSALVRLDQDGSSTTLPLRGDDVVVPPSGVWVADTAGKKVVLIDRESVQVAGFVSIEAPDGIAPGDDGVWVYNTELGTITEVHQDQFGTVVAATPIAIDAQPVDLSSGSGAVWTANLDGSVTKVVDGAVVGAFDLGAKVVAIRVESTTGRVFCLIG
jgi:hypothetical protein